MPALAAKEADASALRPWGGRTSRSSSHACHARHPNHRAGSGAPDRRHARPPVPDRPAPALPAFARAGTGSPRQRRALAAARPWGLPRCHASSHRAAIRATGNTTPPCGPTWPNWHAREDRRTVHDLQRCAVSYAPANADECRVHAGRNPGADRCHRNRQQHAAGPPARIRTFRFHAAVRSDPAGA